MRLENASLIAHSTSLPSPLVFGNVAEPQPVGLLGGEVVLHQIVVDRRADLAVLAALLAEHAPPAVVSRRSAIRFVGHRFTGVRACSSTKKSVAELGSSRWSSNSALARVGL